MFGGILHGFQHLKPEQADGHGRRFHQHARKGELSFRQEKPSSKTVFLEVSLILFPIESGSPLSHAFGRIQPQVSVMPFPRSPTINSLRNLAYILGDVKHHLFSPT